MNKQELASTISARCTLHGEFLLRSGVTSELYFDKYLFEADPLLLNAVTGFLKESIPAEVDMLAGLEMGGIPIATLLGQHSGLPVLFVRKEAKEYGTCKLAEGGDIEGCKLVLIEDVVTSGGQILESTAALRERGAIIDSVLCVINREAGGLENLEKEGLTLHALFTRSELEATVG